MFQQSLTGLLKFAVLNASWCCSNYQYYCGTFLFEVFVYLLQFKDTYFNGYLCPSRELASPIIALLSHSAASFIVAPTCLMSALVPSQDQKKQFLGCESLVFKKGILILNGFICRNSGLVDSRTLILFYLFIVTIWK